MSTQPHRVHVAEIRRTFGAKFADGRPIAGPDGWVVEPIRWNGQQVEIGIDPGHQYMLIAQPELADETARAGLEATGWQPVAVDDEQQELWVRSRAAAATAELDQLRTAPSGPQVAPVGFAEGGWQMLLAFDDTDFELWRRSPTSAATAQLDRLRTAPSGPQVAPAGIA
jgi:hypothetical protein